MRITQTEEYVLIECCACGCDFAVRATYQKKLRETKQTFHCPNGHEQSYRKSTAEILKEELEEQKRANLSLTSDNFILRQEGAKLEKLLDGRKKKAPKKKK